jgi:hypothetical protein
MLGQVYRMQRGTHSHFKVLQGRKRDIGIKLVIPAQSNVLVVYSSWLNYYTHIHSIWNPRMWLDLEIVSLQK